MEDPASLRALLDDATDKLSVVDERGVVTYTNAAVERLLGYAPSDLVGESVFDVIHPGDRDRIRAAFDEVVRADDCRTVEAEYRAVTSDGAVVWLESRLTTRPSSPLDGYVISSRDVTDRKRAEREREEVETRLQQLAENSNDVLWMFTADWGELLFVNEAYEEVYGASTAALGADPTSFLDAVHPDDRASVRGAMECLSNGEAVDVEYRANAAKGYRRWVWVQSQPIVEDGEVCRVVGFTRDVTDHQRRERQLRVMDRLLRHNLRNDMNVILGHADLVAEGATGATAESMRTIARIGEELLATADKEREIVRLLSAPTLPRECDVAEIVVERVAAAREAHPAADITTDVPDTAPASAIPELSIAVGELIENAIQHAGDSHAVLDVSVSVGDDAAELCVRDDGTPIPGMEFEFFGGDVEIDQLSHGRGLGLWLVYWVVDLSDGDLRFASGDRGGNTVTITLPAPRP